jgi:tetratricopeptide (TPR) repeat protein
MRATALTLCAAALLASAAAPLIARHETHPRNGPPPKLGSVTFSNSGSAAAQEPFLRGIALLHSYEYQDARLAFQQAEKADPAFALAYWCEAFTYSQFDWGTEDLPAAQAALARLAPTRDERLAKAGTTRERAFGAAVESFLEGRGSLIERARGFADAMRAWSADAPSDIEAAAFAARGALFVLRYAPPLERVQRTEAAIVQAEKVVAADPNHPGGIHYLIHATDSPRFAAKGLAAARVYDKLAPDADHALHMPSHIYLQLGMWPDVSAANERAWAASRARVDRGRYPVTELGWHSLQWLHYGYVQEGRYREARALVDTAKKILAPTSAEMLSGYPDARYIVETMEFQYGAESGDWPSAAAPGADAAALAARAIAAASLREQQQAMAAVYHAVVTALGKRDVAAAGAGVSAMRAVVASLPTTDPRRAQAELMTSQLDALIARAGGNHAAAVEQLTRLVGAARDTGVGPLGPPSTLPLIEMLGAMLFEAGRFAEAEAAYDRALADRPNRSSALLGLARAKKAARDTDGAFAAYSKLLENWKRADSDLPALAEAKRR